MQAAIRVTDEREGNMRKTLVGLTLVFGTLLTSSCLSTSTPRITFSPITTRAQSNLSTVLTAADTYYGEGDKSFVGVDGPVPPPAEEGWVSDLPQTNLGLRVVSGDRASLNSHTISLYLPRWTHGQALVLTAWAPGTETCWGLVSINKTLLRSKAVHGKTKRGVYYFRARTHEARNCSADTTRIAVISGNEFPPAT